MLTTRWRSSAGPDEYALCLDREGGARLLVIPALFDEGNRLRHFTVEVMRRLGAKGIGSVLPDLPGINESLAPLADQALDGWRADIAAAADHFQATRFLTIRGGALLAHDGMAAIAYAPVAGAAQLRALLRAQAIADREAGQPTTREALLERGLREGVTLAGYDLGPAMLEQMQRAEPSRADAVIEQTEIGGAGLWLRAEPAHDPAQADALAARVAELL